VTHSIDSPKFKSLLDDIVDNGECTKYVRERPKEPNPWLEHSKPDLVLEALQGCGSCVAKLSCQEYLQYFPKQTGTVAAGYYFGLGNNNRKRPPIEIDVYKKRFKHKFTREESK
jgi:hypothetical protein